MLLILADDLTGALDTGLQFAKHKITTVVLPSAGEYSRKTPPPEVLVINTATRHRSSAEARSIVAACARYEADFIYKKTDSTLRGHIGAELEALMDARNTMRLPFIPAYPSLGRTTRKGHQYLRGKLIGETEMADDPLNPVKHSFIPDIIGEESNIPVRLISKGEEIPISKFEREILVFDAETEDDLRKIARDLFQKNLLCESAGCAGFAETLAEVLPLEKRPESFPKNISKNKPVLVVSGSLNPVSIGQVKTAIERGVACSAVTGEKLFDSSWFESEEAKNIVANCVRVLKDQGICILGTEMSLGKTTVCEALPNDQRAEGLSGRLGIVVKMIAGKTGPLVPAVFGGDTLLGVMKNLNYVCLKPLEEICPGVVLSLAEGTEGNSIVITKAGGFGNRSLIQDIQIRLEA